MYYNKIALVLLFFTSTVLYEVWKLIVGAHTSSIVLKNKAKQQAKQQNEAGKGGAAGRKGAEVKKEPKVDPAKEKAEMKKTEAISVQRNFSRMQRLTLG